MRTAAVVVVLAAIWVLLWGSASVANIVTGVLVGTALVMLVPGLRGTKQPLVIRPIAIARLLGHFLVDLIRSNIVLTREIIAPRSRIHTAIVGVELPGCSDELLTADHQPAGTRARDDAGRDDRRSGGALRARAAPRGCRGGAPRGSAAHRPRIRRVRPGGEEPIVIEIAYVVLGLAAVLFAGRAIAGPSLSDRVIGIDGVIVSGMSIIIVNAMDTGRGAFLPAAVVLALVSFVGTSVVARFIEGRGE